MSLLRNSAIRTLLPPPGLCSNGIDDSEDPGGGLVERGRSGAWAQRLVRGRARHRAAAAIRRRLHLPSADLGAAGMGCAISFGLEKIRFGYANGRRPFMAS